MSNLQRLQDILAQDKSECLYCGNLYDRKINVGLPNGMISTTYRYTCHNCTEWVEIEVDDQELELFKIESWIISCRGLYLTSICYLPQILWVDTNDPTKNPPTITSQTLPMFDLNFSDRDKLHTKLQTYLTFS